MIETLQSVAGWLWVFTPILGFALGVWLGVWGRR